MSVIDLFQSTAVFSYKPDFPERPVSCSLQSLEVFSCSLAAEDETALSIIDPMSITIELNGSPSKKVETLGPTGLTDATSDTDSDPPILEVSVLCLSISYKGSLSAYCGTSSLSFNMYVISIWDCAKLSNLNISGVCMYIHRDTFC